MSENIEKVVVQKAATFSDVLDASLGTIIQSTVDQSKDFLTGITSITEGAESVAKTFREELSFVLKALPQQQIFSDWVSDFTDNLGGLGKILEAGNLPTGDVGTKLDSYFLPFLDDFAAGNISFEKGLEQVLNEISWKELAADFLKKSDWKSMGAELVTQLGEAFPQATAVVDQVSESLAPFSEAFGFPLNKIGKLVEGGLIDMLDQWSQGEVSFTEGIKGLFTGGIDVKEGLATFLKETKWSEGFSFLWSSMLDSSDTLSDVVSTIEEKFGGIASLVRSFELPVDTFWGSIEGDLVDIIDRFAAGEITFGEGLSEIFSGGIDFKAPLGTLLKGINWEKGFTAIWNKILDSSDGLADVVAKVGEKFEKVSPYIDAFEIPFDQLGSHIEGGLIDIVDRFAAGEITFSEGVAEIFSGGLGLKEGLSDMLKEINWEAGFDFLGGKLSEHFEGVTGSVLQALSKTAGAGMDAVINDGDWNNVAATGISAFTDVAASMAGPFGPVVSIVGNLAAGLFNSMAATNALIKETEESVAGLFEEVFAGELGLKETRINSLNEELGVIEGDKKVKMDILKKRFDRGEINAEEYSKQSREVAEKAQEQKAEVNNKKAELMRQDKLSKGVQDTINKLQSELDNMSGAKKTFTKADEKLEKEILRYQQLLQEIDSDTDGLTREEAVLMAQNAGIDFAATGANFITSGPQLLMVGENPGGREHVQVTPLSSPNIHGPTNSPAGGQVSVNVHLNGDVYGIDDLYMKLQLAGQQLARNGRIAV